MNKKLIFISGPCIIESRDQAFEIASFLKDLTQEFNLEFIFKASFDKANRTSVKSFRGPGIDKGLRILDEIKKKLGLFILSDVHSLEQARYVKNILDVIQIPAFLCRQTDIIIEAAKTKKIINIKKGQFLAPDDVKYIIEKIESTGNKNIFITERGSCFGYNNLVVDFRSFLIMKKFGYPVIFDVTHSLQRPSAASGISGGDREFAPQMALAAIACGVDGLFMEVHPSPKKSQSDKHTVFELKKLKNLLKKVCQIRQAL